MSTRIVTDSTAYLPREVVERHGIEVVPLHVVVGGRDYVEGRDISAAQVAAALREYTIVTTSRPTPQVFAETYQRLADEGATAIVSVHLSSQMSGTVEAARLAAAEAPVPVEVIDSETIGMAMGFAVVAAAEAAAGGAGVPEVAGRRALAARPLRRPVLRRHPRAPAAGRAHRRRLGAARVGPRDQADPRRPRRTHRAGREGPHVVAGGRAHRGDGPRAGREGRPRRRHRGPPPRRTGSRRADRGRAAHPGAGLAQGSRRRARGSRGRARGSWHRRHRRVAAPRRAVARVPSPGEVAGS